MEGRRHPDLLLRLTALPDHGGVPKSEKYISGNPGNKNHTIRHNMSTNNFESSVFIDRMGKEVSMLGESKVIGNFRIIRN